MAHADIWHVNYDKIRNDEYIKCIKAVFVPLFIPLSLSGSALQFIEIPPHIKSNEHKNQKKKRRRKERIKKKPNRMPSNKRKMRIKETSQDKTV